MSAIARWAVRLIALALGGAVVGTALAALYAAVVWLRLPSVESLDAGGDPGPTAFMREASCERVRRDWVPLERIDPRLGCALVWAEDARFFFHAGVDWDALRGAAEDNVASAGIVRGGSTIPMQLARNLFLTRARLFTRKLREIFLARQLVARLDRRRLLELYLNAVEFAPCVYGAEAGARHYFGHTARRLDLAEATFLAALVSRPSTAPGARRGDRSWFQQKQQRIVRNFNLGRLIGQEEARDGIRAVVGMWAGGWRGYRGADGPAAPMRWYDRACGTEAMR